MHDHEDQHRQHQQVLLLKHMPLTLGKNERINATTQSWTAFPAHH